MSNLDDLEILRQREKDYGDYGKNAHLFCRFYDIFDENGIDRAAPELKLAAIMMCLKLARVVSGAYQSIDSWRDVAGYAVLAERYLTQTAQGCELSTGAIADSLSLARQAQSQKQKPSFPPRPF